MTGLRYAATRVDLTPPTLVPLAGYLARGDALATGTHDQLTGSLIWLAGPDDDTDSVCWVAVDALGLDTDTASRIRTAVADRAGLPADAVLVCCSHTHSGPATWCRPTVPGWRSGFAPAAADRLVTDLARGAARLPATRAPVHALWAATPDAGVGGNRYDPDSPHDASTGVLTLRDNDDAVVAVLFDYACHPTVLNHANLAYSADYPAATRRVVGAGLAETEGVETPPVVAFLQGAAGDASTRFTRRGNDFAEVARQGGMLAGAVLRALLAGSANPVGTAVPAVFRDTVTVPTRALPTPAEAANLVAETRAKLSDGDGTDPAARIARTRHEGALLLAELAAAGLPATVDLPISVVCLGGVAWAHLPVEPFACYGEAIRATSPFPVTRTIGYTDGYFGYLADEAAHQAGRYEALSSLFDPAAGHQLTAATTRLLHTAFASTH